MSNWRLSKQSNRWPVSCDHISWVQVWSSSRSCVFWSWQLTSCWFLIGLQAQAGLTCNQGQVVQKPVNANPELRWLNTIFANTIQHTWHSWTWRWYSNHFIWSMLMLSVLFFFIIEHSVFMVLVCYEKCMLEKVTMQRTLQFADFFCYLKNPVKCNVCVVSQQIVIECGIAF